MDAETIAQKARKAISSFCMEECKSFCCRKGYLPLRESEVDTVTQGKRKELMEQGILTLRADGKYSLYMGGTDMPCPSFQNDRCVIHTSRKRPLTCRQFPIFVDGNTVRISARCLAAKAGLLYPYVARMKLLGYKIVEGDPLADSNLDKFLDSKPDQNQLGRITT
ncbi:YkgJ family cysteine cluster protein [Candidatus Woesearchaeota archaeon]|nr:YkgJ family cysteine cluster protein [Candidatus Woesearchaeota archaeon]